MFKNFKKLSSLTDLSKWKLDKLEEIGNMFEGYDSLNEKPNIFNYKENNSNNISSNDESSNDKKK